MPKTLRSSPERCHICRLPIPQDLVDCTHPLFGTVDHVRPLSLGGRDERSNRAPAHRICNLTKGARYLVYKAEVLELLHPRVRGLLAKRGVVLTKQQLRAAVNRLRVPYKPLDKRTYRSSIGIWEDDGGAVARVEA